MERSVIYYEEEASARLEQIARTAQGEECGLRWARVFSADDLEPCNTIFIMPDVPEAKQQTIVDAYGETGREVFLFGDGEPVEDTVPDPVEDVQEDEDTVPDSVEDANVQVKEQKATITEHRKALREMGVKIPRNISDEDLEKLYLDSVHLQDDNETN